MNRYQQHIKALRIEDGYYREEMKRFSRELKYAMELSTDDLQFAMEKQAKWNIPGFTIIATSFNWFTDKRKLQPILVVVPATASIFHPWFKNSTDIMPLGWHIKQTGASGEILPTSEAQRKIHEIIKKNQ